MALRLNSWLASKGGVKDPGGDVLATIGDYRLRPGLINNTSGLSLDDAACAAWEEGYFFGEDRPDINRLLDAIAQDHNGRIPVYAECDFAEVEARRHRVQTREHKAETGSADPALDLLRAMVQAWRTGGEGKRKALRPLMREAERMVAA